MWVSAASATFLDGFVRHFAATTADGFLLPFCHKVLVPFKCQQKSGFMSGERGKKRKKGEKRGKKKDAISRTVEDSGIEPSCTSNPIRTQSLCTLRRLKLGLLRGPENIEAETNHIQIEP